MVHQPTVPKLMGPFLAAGVIAALAFLAQPAAGIANGKLSPYVDLQEREIKSLSRDEISRYLSGRGLKVALTGELNHYPGPRDSLELQGKLNLSGKQRRKTRLIFERLRADAVRLGTMIVTREKN